MKFSGLPVRGHNKKDQMKSSSEEGVLNNIPPTPATALPPLPRPENHPKTDVLEALDALALALAEHGHQWTPRERALYEKAVENQIASVQMLAEARDLEQELWAARSEVDGERKRIAALQAALRHIAEMPERDQDDAHRMRHVAAQTLKGTPR